MPKTGEMDCRKKESQHGWGGLKDIWFIIKKCRKKQTDKPGEGDKQNSETGEGANKTQKQNSKLGHRWTDVHI